MNKYNILSYFTTQNTINNNQVSSYLESTSNISINSSNFKFLSYFLKDDYTINSSNEILSKKTYDSK